MAASRYEKKIFKYTSYSVLSVEVYKKYLKFKLLWFTKNL